ncbi:hypothetical protein L915_14829 [Phytophthora nicotianae]|uniref:HAT C-terminal dimerisation domain-containing protein n=1 Tax=Phytophthora nicotianae TaxID=4792 RepID=W2GAQ2_PHYNI|nr:hypothetical protein L915_14829 [Phytophthora nicotianae]
MVTVSRPIRPSFTSAQVSRFFFQPCRDDYAEVIDEYFRCRCGTVRKQTRRNGFSNLLQHVRREHPDFETTMREASTTETGSLLSYVRQSSQNLYGNLPLTFCENRATKRYTTLDPIYIETLRSTMNGVTVAVERSIASEMPKIFGLILDGWTHLSEHYIAVFACYEVNGQVKTPILCMTPLMNEPDDDLSAVAHREFLANMLSRDFGKQLDQCVFLVGDNCSVNKRLATLIGVPLIGCASHRLNRAVQHELHEHKADLAEVQALMIKLRTLTQSAKLRLKTDLRPVIRQDTRWSSTFMMLHRYFELLEHLDTTDDEIADLLPSASCNRRLRALLKELMDVESVSKALQGTNDNLLDVREWFDGLIGIKPQYAYNLGTAHIPSAAIVHSPDFESGCVRVLRGNTTRLTRSEKTALRAFEVTTDERLANDDTEGSFVERMEKRRCLARHEQRYVLLRSVLPTSNMVERFFSIARTPFGHERNGLQPITLEQILFLRQNAGYWDASTVDRARQ